MNSLPGCRADGGRAFRNARSFQPAPRRSAHPASLILLGLLTPSLLALLSSSPSIGLGVLALPRSQPLRRDVTLSSDVLRPDDSHDDLLSDEDGFDWSAHSEDQISAKREGRMRVQDAPGGGNTNQLHGRFLHLTDIHPDELYKVAASIPMGCHDDDPKPRKGNRAAYWGTSYSDCDSPLSLYNVTMDWLEQEWADEVDFVIWTGDNARHDIDPGHPRTEEEIYSLNRMIVDRMSKIFLSRGVPVVPSIGNNDIWPHNIMYPGPSKITHTYASLWSKFIPFDEYQVFQRGAYYSVDLIANKLGALSLNTLYFYDKNNAVEGCGKRQPGKLQLDWMEVQLEIFRGRGMQVWITGHVPPSKNSYFPDCFARYGELSIRYQDTIVGQLFGHMNVDHFFWIDLSDLRPLPVPVPALGPATASTLAWQAITSIMNALPFLQPGLRLVSSVLSRFFLQAPPSQRKSALDVYLSTAFASIPKISKLDLNAFSPIVFVSPSIVPTYLPSLRIFTYNVSGNPGNGGSSLLGEDEVTYAALDEEDEDGDQDSLIKRRDCRLIKDSSKKACRLKKPRHNNSSSPSRKNNLFSPLGYCQFVIEGLSDLKATQTPKFTLEYMTYDLSVLQNTSKYPVPHQLLPSQLLNPSISNSSVTPLKNTLIRQERSAQDLAPYGLPDLTIGSYVRFARRLGISSQGMKHKKLWKRFREFMYMTF